MNQSNNLFSSKFTGKSFLSNTVKDLSSLESEKKSSRILKSFQKVQIQVKNQILDDLLQVYSWRSKVQLPIVKVLFYKVIQRNPDQFQTTIQVSYESCFLTLSNMNEISISNALYLIKQSLIGFQKLFNVFGSFLISNKMIGVNKNNRCKVWINQNFAVNQPIDVQFFKNKSEKEFLQQLLQLFKKKTQKNKTTLLLFTELSECINFYSANVSFDSFVKKNNLEVAKSYKLQQINERKNNPSKSPLKNPNQMATNSFIGKESRKIPQFLNKSQIGQSRDLNDSLITSSKISTRIQKSKSNTKIRDRTPLTHNRSQVNLYNPSKSPLKNLKKQEQASRLDYSFQDKQKSSSRLEKKKTNNLIQSATSISHFEVNNSCKEKQLINLNKKSLQPQQVIKSDINTTHTNNSAITTRTRSILQKKTSIFDADRNLIESIVIGNEHEKRKTNLFSTSDLQHLGKLGKNVVQSCMPEDFKH